MSKCYHRRLVVKQNQYKYWVACVECSKQLSSNYNDNNSPYAFIEGWENSLAEMEDIKTALHYGKFFGEELLQDMHGPEYEGEGSQLVIEGYKNYLEKIKQAMIYLGDEDID